MRIEHRLLVERAWALRDNVSFYDGLYVALAEELERHCSPSTPGSPRRRGWRGRAARAA